MNLHSLASPYVAAVSPPLKASVQRSIGYATAVDGKRVPVFAKACAMDAQVQALQWKDLQQLDGLNINGIRLAMYLTGDWGGVSRPDKRGGDLVTLPDTTVWLVVLVLENWAMMDNWCKVAVVRQQDGAI